MIEYLQNFDDCGEPHVTQDAMPMILHSELNAINTATD